MFKTFSSLCSKEETSHVIMAPVESRFTAKSLLVSACGIYFSTVLFAQCLLLQMRTSKCGTAKRVFSPWLTLARTQMDLRYALIVHVSLNLPYRVSPTSVLHHNRGNSMYAYSICFLICSVPHIINRARWETRRVRRSRRRHGHCQKNRSHRLSKWNPKK